MRAGIHPVAGLLRFAFGFVSPRLGEFIFFSTAKRKRNQKKMPPSLAENPSLWCDLSGRLDAASRLKRASRAHPCALNPKNHTATRQLRRGNGVASESGDIFRGLYMAARVPAQRPSKPMSASVLGSIEPVPGEGGVEQSKRAVSL